MARPLVRLREMASLAVAMMFHDKAKLAAGLVGVVFATVLVCQQVATFIALIEKNTLLVDHLPADVWILPPGARQLQAGELLEEQVRYRAAAVPGVAWTAPLLWVNGNVSLPGGGSEPVSVLGIAVEPGGRLPYGGPWDVVAGEPAALALPDAMFFEQDERRRLGGLNLGSVREVSGVRVRVVGFTWGLLPFAPSFAFTSYDQARRIGRVEDRDQTAVLVGVAPGHDPEQVAERLRAQVGTAQVYTRAGLHASTVRYVLTETGIGITIGTASLIGLIVGFVVVAIAMFGSVVDHMREFGTLKAIGAAGADLAALLLVQAVVYAAIGSAVGLVVAGLVADQIRSAQLTLVLPRWLLAGVVVVMLILCVLASSLALLRLRRVEPGMVFRG